MLNFIALALLAPAAQTSKDYVVARQWSSVPFQTRDHWKFGFSYWVADSFLDTVPYQSTSVGSDKVAVDFGEIRRLLDRPAAWRVLKDLSAIAILSAGLGSQATAVSVRDGDEIAFEHMDALIQRHKLHVALGPWTGWGGDGFTLTDAPAEIARLFAREAPPGRFSIRVWRARDFRAFSDPDVATWPFEKTVLALSKRFPTLPVKRAMEEAGISTPKPGRISYLKRRYIGPDQKWHEGLDIVMLNGDTAERAQILPSRKTYAIFTHKSGDYLFHGSRKSPYDR